MRDISLSTLTDEEAISILADGLRKSIISQDSAGLVLAYLPISCHVALSFSTSCADSASPAGRVMNADDAVINFYQLFHVNS